MNAPANNAAATSATVNPITAEMIRHALLAIPNQIDLNITRTAYSPIIYVYKDFACGIVDRGTEKSVRTRAIHRQQQRVSAGNQENDRGEFEARVVEQRRVEMRLEVVDGNERQPVHHGQRFRRNEADNEPAEQPGEVEGLIGGGDREPGEGVGAVDDLGIHPVGRVEPHRVECRVPRDDELGRLIAGRVEQRFLARQRVRRLRHLAPVGPFAKQGSFE